MVLYNAFVVSWGLTITQNSIHTISDLDRSRLSDTQSAENDRIGADTDPEYQIDASLVRALRIYVERTRSFRCSEQLFVCYGGQQKGMAVSKQRLGHWLVDAITLVYQSQGEPCTLGVRAHSTRSCCLLLGVAHGASLADIRRAAG